MAKRPTTPKFKTNLHTIFQTSRNAEEDGAWVVINAFQGLRIKVRRLRSDTAVKAYNRIIQELLGEGKLRASKEITPEEILEVTKRQLAEAVLIDWENLRDEETGEPIPYSQDAALALMDIKDFREYVTEVANDRDNFREASDKEAEGN